MSKRKRPGRKGAAERARLAARRPALRELGSALGGDATAYRVAAWLDRRGVTTMAQLRWMVEHDFLVNLDPRGRARVLELYER